MNHWDTILIHPNLVYGPFQDISDTGILPKLQKVAIVQLAIWAAVCITLIVFAVTVRLQFRKNSLFSTNELANHYKEKLQISGDVVYYGGRRRYNKHFFYRVRTGLIHLPKSWFTKKTIGGDFWVTYSFINMIDVQTKHANYITKSIWPTTFMIFGLVFSSFNVFFTCIMPMDYSQMVGALTTSVAWGIYTLLIFSTILILIGWIWWFFLFKKVFLLAKAMIKDVFPVENQKNLIRLFKLVLMAPLMINIVAKEHFPKAEWDEEDPQFILDMFKEQEVEMKAKAAAEAKAKADAKKVAAEKRQKMIEERKKNLESKKHRDNTRK